MRNIGSSEKNFRKREELKLGGGGGQTLIMGIRGRA